MNKHISLYLFTFYFSLAFLVEYHRLELLNASHFHSYKITEHNREQHIKNYFGLFVQVVLLLSTIPYLYYLLYNRSLFLESLAIGKL